MGELEEGPKKNLKTKMMRMWTSWFLNQGQRGMQTSPSISRIMSCLGGRKIVENDW